jgi:hypothetical protein
MIIYTEACFYCKHLNANTRGRHNKYKCTEFSNGVPSDIYTGQFDHRNAYPDDLGVRFIPAPDFINRQGVLDEVFDEIEKKRAERFANPKFKNPLPYDWKNKT